MRSIYFVVDRNICGTCKHYRQHYVLHAGVYFPLDYGHCVRGRGKKRGAWEDCEQWEASAGTEKAEERRILQESEP